MTDEKSILEQFAAGNHTAFRELFMRYHLKVYYFVLGLVKSESDAEDLTQEIFLKLWTHRSRFTEVRTFGSYLYVLAKHTAFNYIESRRVNLVSLERAGEEDGERSDTPLRGFSCQGFTVASGYDRGDHAATAEDDLPDEPRRGFVERRDRRESTTLEKDRGKPLEPSAKGIAERGIDFPSCYDVLMAWG